MLTLYVYLWGISDAAGTFFATASVVLGIAFVIRYIIYLMAIYNADDYDEPWYDERKRLKEDLGHQPSHNEFTEFFKHLKPRWVHTPMFIICTVLAILIPDRQTIALMYILPQVQKVMPSPETVSAEGREMYDYVKEWMKAEIKKKTAEAKAELPPPAPSTTVPDNQSR